MRSIVLSVALITACTAPTEEPRTTHAATETTAAAATATEAAPPFDRGAAARAIAAVHPEECRAAGGPAGRGHVTVLFAVDGSASIRDLDPPYADTEVGECIAAKFASIRVPPFSGTPVRVGKTFEIAPP